jgi:hypothetical protein
MYGNGTAKQKEEPQNLKDKKLFKELSSVPAGRCV